MTASCTRCRRPLRREPVIVEGKGYGPTCAAKIGDLLTQIAKNPAIVSRRKRKADASQAALFAEVQP